MNEDRHILITGGAGYIGSLLTAELLRAGFVVTVMDNLLFGGDWLVAFLPHPRFRFVKTDLTEARAVKDGLRGEFAGGKSWATPEDIVHLAGIVGFPACQAVGRQVAWKYNVEATQLVFEQACSLGVERMVFSSSYSNYGMAPDVYAAMEGRECINPRPEDQAVIFRDAQPHTVGFITYSEGCNDDVNKAVWSALSWNPDTSVPEILRDYARVFLGERLADEFAAGLLALEDNWRGPLAENFGVEATLERFRELERRATPIDLRNWRLQAALYRAYFDAYVRARLLYERELERQAMDA